MDRPDISTVAVLGAGTMGHGIAEIAAISGYTVTLRDVNEELVEKGSRHIRSSLDRLDNKGKLDESVETIMDRIHPEVDLETAVESADLVVEVAPEELDLKREIFNDLSRFTPPQTILSTNTSSLSITKIAEATDRPEKVVGIHFFNPPVVMELVEIVYGRQTEEATARAAHAFAESLGKTPIYVRKDVHGFIVNRELIPFLTEPCRMVEAGETTVREADAAMVHRRGYPMGPFELLDFIGIDVFHHILKEGDIEVPPPLQEKYEQKKLGRKSGQGFYQYENGGPDYEAGDGVDFDTLRIEALLVNEAAWLVENEVAEPEDIDTAMKLGTRFPEGVCARGDSIGLDKIIEKLQSLNDLYDRSRYVPTDLLKEMVQKGHTGEKEGKGFYSYEE